MVKLLKKIKKDNRGSQTLEFVLLMPIVLFLLFGFIILSLTITSWVIVVDSAREGARAEALGLATAEEKVKDTLSGYSFSTSPQRLKVEKHETDTYITVKVTYKQPSFAPGLPLLIGGSPWDNYFELTAKSSFKKEN